ncbi:MAG: hypothetical protein PHE27_05495 [Alphaproteobacteria bacterium]|nr:hypothetical protein [Alphaproteobacteria bacterium]
MSLVSSSMNLIAPLAAYRASAAHVKNETSDDAVAIGNLDEQSTVISISDAGEEASEAVSKTFTTTTGGAVTLSKSFTNVVSAVSATFQLFDSVGTVLASNATDATDAQKAAYNEWVDGSLYIEAGTYTATATPGNGASLSIESYEQQGTSLEVKSTLTGGNPSEYYSFSLSGTTVKLDLTSTGKSDMRVVLYNDNGAVVADSAGNAYQKAKYVEMISASGLNASSGDYVVEITYANGADETADIDYTMTLYSGNTYSVVYKTAAEAQPYDNSASGSVTADSDAELYTNTAYNKIVTSAGKAINVGWLKQNESMLDIYSMLTSADSTDYYKFTFQEGESLKLDFNENTTADESALRVQLLDITGTNVIADSEGTADQRAAYAKLTSASGLEADTGTYVIKVTYADGAEKTDSAYEIGIYSGSTYVAQYKTTASAQTYANAILAGEMSETSTNVSLASVLSGDTDAWTESLMTALKLLG